MPRVTNLFDLIKDLQRRVGALEKNRQPFTSDIVGVGAVLTQHISNLAVTNAKIQDLAAGKITTGTLIVAIDVGVGNVKIDGINKRILISDATLPRIVMGDV